MRSDLPVESVREYPGVRDVAYVQGSFDITTTEPEALLRRAFGEGWRVEELSVERVDLETAFRQLTEEIEA
jgi:hypothetical protein